MIPALPYELLIFDLDGTLIDSEKDLANAVNTVRALYGKKALALPVVRSYIGSGVVTLMERSLPGVPPVELAKAIGAFRDQYRAHLLDTTVLYPGVMDVLARYKEKKKVVLTNKPEDISLQIVAQLGIGNNFALVWGGDTGPRKKPDPEPVFNILSLLNVPGERSIMIGDGPNDMLAAKNAGIKCIAVTYGYSTREELARYSPDYFIDSMEELTKLLA